MTLTPTQTILLTAAADMPQGRVTTFPATLRGGAKAKVLAALVAHGLIKADRQGHRLTTAGYAAINRDVPGRHPTPAAPRDATTARAGSKQAQVIAMLQRAQGATLAELAEATGWQHHTVRGTLSGALRKKRGLPITSEICTDRGRVYRLPGEAVTA